MEPSVAGTTSYQTLVRQLRSLLEGERDAIANAANTAALIFGGVVDLNWAGFYFRRGEELVLGPFQGKVACVRIPWGAGVCGTSAARDETIVVPDVHAFEGHIACDSASNAELVVPLRADGRVIGVLDLDSPTHGRFTEEDRRGIEELARVWCEAIDPGTLPGRDS